MRTVHLKASTGSGTDYRLDLALATKGSRQLDASVQFPFDISEEQENLRWYLEDFLQSPYDPAPQFAARIQTRMHDIGIEIFKKVFESSEDARRLWRTVSPKLEDTRFEIECGAGEAIPWEFIRDTKTGRPLALSARAFVRVPRQAVQPLRRFSLKGVSHGNLGGVRILLVICRPGGASDIPFRSVAIRLLKGLGEAERSRFKLDVLRPPTFERLVEALNAAKGYGQPYDIVHFDGHGIYEDPTGTRQKRGYLLFENPGNPENQEYIHGGLLGNALSETGTALLILNACRSAYIEAASEPGKALPDNKPSAFGSLAEEVIAAGVSGVVAMRYNVYVTTAAEFVAGIYARLAGRYSLGEAVTLGRRQLAEKPLRDIGLQSYPLEDWTVPLVYEAQGDVPKPIEDRHSHSFRSPLGRLWNLLKRRGNEGGIDRKNEVPIQWQEARRIPEERGLDPEVLKIPEAGFLGRDEVLLAIDRAFDTHSIVLLHAFAGSGKTSTASEFSRWYSQTGGTDGPVLFSSFERHKPLASALNETVGRIFDGSPSWQRDRDWLLLNEAERTREALKLFESITVLWIWDSVEAIGGFPKGTNSAWSEAEQRELLAFLLESQRTKARFLLTSRRDERDWLGDLPERIGMPPMPMLERIQLARALAERRSRSPVGGVHWRPLLQFTEGNPLAITVLVGQALHNGFKTKDEFETFAAHLRAGETAFDDEQSSGRSKSLGAALKYGFDHAFQESERKQLALLQFFQGFVSAAVFRRIQDHESKLPESSDTAATTLLDRAAEVGLLTPYGPGLYGIHPALPWFFKNLLDRYYPWPAELKPGSPNPRLSAVRAFAEIMGQRSEFLYSEFHKGKSHAMAFLMAEEQNILHARQLARAHGWWDVVLFAMQGLDVLYNHRGHLAEWAELVAEVAPDFVDPATDGPREGLEEHWSIVTDYRVGVLVHSRRLAEAERLRRIRLEWVRRRDSRKTLGDPMSNTERAAKREQASSLELSGRLQSELNDPGCVETLEEAFNLYVQVEEPARAAACALMAGVAYKNISAVRDLGKGEHWFSRSLELRDELDTNGRGCD